MAAAIRKGREVWDSVGYGTVWDTGQSRIGRHVFRLLPGYNMHILQRANKRRPAARYFELIQEPSGDRGLVCRVRKGHGTTNGCFTLDSKMGERQSWKTHLQLTMTSSYGSPIGRWRDVFCKPFSGRWAAPWVNHHDLLHPIPQSDQT